jgi:hypothetical protein
VVSGVAADGRRARLRPFQAVRRADRGCTGDRDDKRRRRVCEHRQQGKVDGIDAAGPAAITPVGRLAPENTEGVGFAQDEGIAVDALPAGRA